MQDLLNKPFIVSITTAKPGVIDFPRQIKKEVESRLKNMGSRLKFKRITSTGMEIHGKTFTDGVRFLELFLMVWRVLDYPRPHPPDTVRWHFKFIDTDPDVAKAAIKNLQRTLMQLTGVPQGIDVNGVEIEVDFQQKLSFTDLLKDLERLQQADFSDDF